MELDLSARPSAHTSTLPPYHVRLPTPSSTQPQPTTSNQLTTQSHPVSMDTPTETPHDLFCLAKEYERRGRLSDATNLYLRASMNGHLAAMVSYASHLVASDERTAFVWFRAAAERGDARAWAELGQLLARGCYFEVNAIDAARCWKRAAQMGDNTGKSALGLCYIRGFGVRQDPAKGIEIVRQVADVHNDVTAMKNLAWIYRHGKGVTKNLAEADYWEKRAKKQEMIIVSNSSREQALFGRGRTRQHKSRSATRDERSSSKPSSAKEPEKPPVYGEQQSVKPIVRNSHATVLEEEDIRTRLKGISTDPSRHAPAQLEHSTDSATAAAAATAEHSGTKSTQTEEAKPTSRATPVSFAQPKWPATEPERLIGAKAYGISKETIPASTTAAVATAAAVASTTVETNVESATEQTAQQEQELQRRAVEAFKEVNAETDPKLGAAVQDLSFKRNNPSQPATEATVERFEFPESEIQAVQAAATARAAEEAITITDSFGESTRVVEEKIIHSTSDIVPSSSKVVETPIEADEPSDEQFLTPPEQSVENEKVHSSSLGKAAGATLSATAIGAAALGSGQSDLQRETALKSSGEEAISAAAGLTGDVREGAEPGGSSEGVQEVERGDLDGMSPIDEGDPREFLPASVESRTKMFEDTTAAAAGEASGLTGGNSYSLSGAEDFSAAQQTANHLDEFEQADMRKITSEGLGTQPVYAPEGTVGCKITRASTFAKETRSALAKESAPVAHAKEMSSSEERKHVPESRFTSEIQSLPHDERSALVREGGNFIEEPYTQQPLEDVLALYPKNPLRSDSQVPLYRILETIQNLPADDPEAYAALDQGHAFSKVIVAMLSQHEDGALQEQGLHCFVRILRNTPSSQKESLVLMPYANCFRTVQGSAEAVVPKGSIDIDEQAPGAIQAVVHALRNFESMRRVLLAGCAALGEIGTVSSSCRSSAYEYGAVTLIIGALRHRSTQAASAIHDTASRAVGSFCGGKENIAFKEAFANAGAVIELLKVLQLWGHSQEHTSELPVTATKSTCSALRHITESSPLAAAKCVQSFGYHHLTRTMAARRDDVIVCTLVVSAMTSITRNAGTVAEKGLLDAKPLREVLITMQAHSDQPVFIRKSLDFMEALACYHSMREAIVAAGGIPFAVDVIQKGGNDSLMLERACGVVEKLCRSNAKNQGFCADNNGIASLTALLKTHQGLPEVVEKGLLALASACTNNPKTQKEAVKLGTPEQVVQSLGGYSSKDSKVAAAAAATMAAMVVPRNAATAQSFAKLKAPELVVRAMKRHPESVMVQENGSAAISSFCEADPRIISLLLKSGISSVLVMALQRYLHKQTAVVQVVRAMRAISNEASEDSYRFKSKLLTDRSNESSLSEIFHTALSYHKKSLPETANVIISICATINRLCMRSVAFKNEIGKDGIVEELKRLVERTAEYRDLGALQPVLATICTLVLDSEDNKNRFHAVGGVEAILDVMQKWKSDTYVLEHCCAALRYSCNEHFGNCDEVKRHNGVRSILGVMELHPDNVNVTLWCCLTLADLCKGDEELQSSPNVVQGIRKVVSAMTMFSSNSRFLASACEFLRAASVDNVENQERIVRLGGRTAIVKALETHPADSTLTEAAAYALLQVQEVVDSRDSADNEPQLGFVRRLSRDLRRSSSSNRSNRPSRIGILGRKSRSFTAKRRSTEEIEPDRRLSQAAGDEALPERRQTTRPSLINFSRRYRSNRKLRRGEVEEEVEEELDAPEHYEEGADDGYEEYSPAPVAVGGSEPQID